MSTSIDRKTKILTTLVACLIALAAVQMYFLYEAHRQAGGNVANATTSSGMQTFKLAPDPKTQVQSIPPLNVPLNGVPSTPFNAGTWDPFKEMDAMHKEMEKMFSQAFGRFSMSPQFGGLAQGFSFNPDADMSENDHEYIVKMDVPGVDKSKVDVKLEGQVLSISGVREEQSQQKAAGKEVSRERTLGSFNRTMTLPGPAKNDGMHVDYEKGVLTVTIPKDTSPHPLQPTPIQ